MLKITVESLESDYVYTEITDFRTVEDILEEHRRLDWDIELLRVEQRPLTPQELTLELVRSA